MKGRRRSEEARGVAGILREYFTYRTHSIPFSFSFSFPPPSPPRPSLQAPFARCSSRRFRVDRGRCNPHAVHSTPLYGGRRVVVTCVSDVQRYRKEEPCHTRVIGARCRDRVRCTPRSVADVDLQERYSEHTRTARRRALCERRRLRHAAAILLRQRGDSAGADKAGQIRATSEQPDVRSGETTVNLATEPPSLGGASHSHRSPVVLPPSPPPAGERASCLSRRCVRSFQGCNVFRNRCRPDPLRRDHLEFDTRVRTPELRGVSTDITFTRSTISRVNISNIQRDQ